MENASKAIIMAGGVLLAMLLLGLLAYAWTKYGEYQDAQDSITDVENVAKFNEQFTNYQRDDVQGYELISLSNKVADYNNRYAASSASAEGATGTGSYSEITLIIYMYDGNASDSTQNVLKLTQNGKDAYLFTAKSGLVYEQSLNTKLTKNVFKDDIYDKATTIETEVFGDSSSATRVAKAIDKIFYYYSSGDPVKQDNVDYLKQSKNMDDDDIKEYGLLNYNSCISTNSKKLAESDINKLYATTNKNSDCLYNKAMTYYEYMMFKTMVFKCQTLDGKDGISYDSETQRVKTITFVCTGEFAD